MEKKKKSLFSKTLTAFLFIFPFFILYTVFIIWPVIQGIYVSLHKWGLMGKIRFLGLGNYTRFFQDRYFWEALGHTAWFVIISVPLLVVVPLCLGILANRGFGIKKFLRISYYIPTVLSVAVISRIARWFFEPYTGVLSYLLHDWGILAPNEEIMWLQTVGLLWTVITLTTVWWTIGFSMMLVVSALQDIPEQLYEAAELDGAGKTRQLFNITLPLLKPVTYLILLLQTIASFKIFGQIQLISGGGPGTATRPLIQYIYDSSFRQNDMGYGAAMSYALFIILVALSYTLANYAYILGKSSVPIWTFNSFLIAILSTGLGLTVSALAAYPLAKMEFRGKRSVFFYFLMGLMVPGEATIVPLFITVNGFYMIDTYAGMILPGVAGSMALIIMVSFFKAFPKELIEVAQIDGAKHLVIFSRIIIPLSRTVLATNCILAFIGSWNNYLWPLLCAMSERMFTLPVGLPTFELTYASDRVIPITSNMAASIPAILIFLIFERQITQGIALTGIKE